MKHVSSFILIGVFLSMQIAQAGAKYQCGSEEHITVKLETHEVKDLENRLLIDLSISGLPTYNLPNPDQKILKMSGSLVGGLYSDKMIFARGVIGPMTDSELWANSQIVQLHIQRVSNEEMYMSFYDSDRIFHHGFGLHLSCKREVAASL